MRPTTQQEGLFQLKASASGKKIIALLLALVTVFSLYGCTDTGEEQTTAPEEDELPLIPGGSLSVPYIESDSLNPYFAKTLHNCSLTSLLYRSLYTLDTAFMPVPDIAVTESLSGKLLKVFINPDLVFSDGSAVTAEDVRYSFDCARASERYGTSLSGISSCYTSDEKTVVFELSRVNENVLSLLTFPVVKNGTAATREMYPVGNGFYQFSEDGIRLTLKANLRYSGTLPEIGTIRLTDVSRNTSPANLVATNELDFYYSDLSDSDVSGVNCSSTGVYLNNLVFMGVNHYNVNLVLATFRQALSFAIDRQTIAESAFMGYARGAVVPFNTSWGKYSSSLSASKLSLTADGTKTQELLSAHGFGEGGHLLELTLLCNEGNAFIRNAANEIAAALKPYNVNITIRLMNSEDLRKAVKEGLYDLYIAEIKLSADMDLTEFLSYGGNAAYGIDFSHLTCHEEYQRFRNGEITLDDFIAVFNRDMPFIPLVYRNGRFLYTRDVVSELYCAENFFYSDINNLKFTGR